MGKSFKSIVEYYTPDQLSLFQERIISGLDEIKKQWAMGGRSSDKRRSMDLSIERGTRRIVLKDSFKTFETVSQNLTDRFLLPYVTRTLENSRPDSKNR